MHPRTDRIIELFGETKNSELLQHARRMEGGLRDALRELERVNNVKDGQPLVSHNALNHFRALLVE